MVVVHEQGEVAEPREEHLSLGLKAESRSHVIVAVDDIVVVALRTAEEDEIGKDGLLQTLEITHLRKLPHHAGTEGGGFRDAVWSLVGAVLHGLGVVVVEVLEDSDDRLSLLAVVDSVAPELAEQVEIVDERLVAGEARGEVQREIVVRLRVAVVEGVAIEQVEGEIRLVLATEDPALISEIAVAHAHGKLHGYAAEVVVHVSVLAHDPRVAVDESVESLHRVGDKGGGFTQEAAEAACAVVQYERRYAVHDFTDADAAEGGSQHVVDSRRFHFTAELPHQAAAQSVRSTLPEVQSVAAGRVEIEVAVVRMCEEVGRELIVVPYEGVVPVVCDAFEGDLCEVLVHDEAVEAMHEDVDARCLCCGAPPSLLGIAWVAPPVEAVLRCQCQLAEHELPVT